MEDTRTIRQMIIDRVDAYIRGLEFYNPELGATYQFDYDSMSDKELVHEFEMLVFNHHKIKEEYRRTDPHGMHEERRR